MWFRLSVVALIIGACTSSSPTKQEVYCGACRMLVDEIEHHVAISDPKKTIEVGSFRVDPKGNQKLSEVPYARSELHLHELIEKACDKSRMYGYAQHPTTKLPTFIRVENFDGRKRKIDAERSELIKSKLMFACESILEEHEEHLVKLLSKESPTPDIDFCLELTKYCPKEDFTTFPYEVEELPPPEAPADAVEPESEKKDTATEAQKEEL